MGYVRDCFLEQRDLPAELTVNGRWGKRRKRNFKLSKKVSKGVCVKRNTMPWGAVPCVCYMDACKKVTSVELRREAGRSAPVGRGFSSC